MTDSLMLPEEDDDEFETKLKASVPEIVNIIRGATALKEQAADTSYFARNVEIALEDLGLLDVGEKRRRDENEEDEDSWSRRRQAMTQAGYAKYHMPTE
jgi:hypothetical protein